MTRSGHRRAGVIFAVAALFLLQAHAAVAACGAAGIVAGSNAPDWIEKPLLLVHRTWTHWPGWWAGLLAAGLALLPLTPTGAAVAGFGAGGLLHLVLDICTPTGIPLRWPPAGRIRVSLPLYRTGDPVGEAMALLVVAAVCAALCALHF